MAPTSQPDPAGEPKISDGPNARPRNEPIGQSGVGVPDDSSHQVEITPEEEEAIARKILDHLPQPDGRVTVARCLTRPARLTLRSPGFSPVCRNGRPSTRRSRR